MLTFLATSLPTPLDTKNQHWMGHFRGDSIEVMTLSWQRISDLALFKSMRRLTLFMGVSLKVWNNNFSRFHGALIIVPETKAVLSQNSQQLRSLKLKLKTISLQRFAMSIFYRVSFLCELWQRVMCDPMTVRVSDPGLVSPCQCFLKISECPSLKVFNS